jgi:hypothetical protein
MKKFLIIAAISIAVMFVGFNNDLSVTVMFGGKSTPQPVVNTTLLPAGGFGRPHTVTGGW